jgi:hypothetical protein
LQRKRPLPVFGFALSKRKAVASGNRSGSRGWAARPNTPKEISMGRQVARLVLGGALLVLGFGALAMGGNSLEMADMKGDVQKIADAFAKGDEEGAKKLAAEAAKTIEMDPLMHLFSVRGKGGKSKGFGVGEKAGSITPDGIEQKIMNFSKKAPTKAVVTKEGEDLLKMAYRSAAIAEIALQKAPAKDMGDKKKKDWIAWAEGTRAGSLELADALKSQDLTKIKTAAAKVTTNCNNCHGTFRD